MFTNKVSFVYSSDFDKFSFNFYLFSYYFEQFPQNKSLYTHMHSKIPEQLPYMHLLDSSNRNHSQISHKLFLQNRFIQLLVCSDLSLTRHFLYILIALNHTYTHPAPRLCHRIKRNKNTVFTATCLQIH